MDVVCWYCLNKVKGGHNIHHQTCSSNIRCLASIRYNMHNQIPLFIRIKLHSTRKHHHAPFLYTCAPWFRNMMVSLRCSTIKARFSACSLYPLPSTISRLRVARLVLQPIGKRRFSSASTWLTSSFNSRLPWLLPWFTASMVEQRNSRIASSTCSSVAIGDSVSFASDSVIRTIASSWRTVMGIDDRVLASISAAWTCRRMETKWDDSFSAAAGLKRGAHRLAR